jgi:putative transposase
MRSVIINTAPNAVLGEGRKRLKLLKESKRFQSARKLPKGVKKTQQFKDLCKNYGFSEYSLHKFATQLLKSWLGQHVGSTVAQTLATRAFRALQKLASGKAKRVRFKNKSGLDSIEEKSDTGFKWKKTGVQFKKLFMPAIIAPEDPISAYALTKKWSSPEKVDTLLGNYRRFELGWCSVA